MPKDAAASPVPPAPALEAETRVRIAALADDPAALEARLAELEAEWDIERVIAANVAFSSALATGIGLARGRGLLRLNLPVTVLAFVLQHAVRGVRPPVALLRRWGFRTEEEIEQERLALLALQGAAPETVRPRSRPSLAGTLARHGRRLFPR